eukprot:TRINITY_DN2219_c1_g1_i6.p1 TRINITY_DN2219_c1_g1~~TRINITY_DN2219_c1_g1_i6.p1  ORF type:complete len:730 (+),score=143.43 TRINITY_DN2219_c1_g1_i6:2220-4409(+)
MFGFYGDDEEEEEYEEEMFYYEDLSPIDRIIEFVLHSDVPVQRVSTLQTICQVAEEVGFNDTRDQLIPIMEQLVKDPEFTIRMVTAEQIIEIANFLEQYEDNGLAIIETKLVPFCIDLSQDQQSEVRETAVCALIACVQKLPTQTIEALILPVIINFATSSADEDLRSLSIVIIDQLAESLTKELMASKCVPLIQELSEDPLFRVRKTVAASLCGVSKTLADDAISSILPIFLKLCQDEIWGVRKVCAENIVELATCFPIQTRINSFQTVYTRFLTDQSRWVKTSANEHLGEFIHLLADDKNNINDSLITHFISMASSSKSASIASSSDSDDNVLCAFNFPAVLLTLGPEYWPRLREAYTTLCTDMQWKVRRTLAFSIHEIATILGQEITKDELLPAFDMFIRDLDEVRIGCVTHIADFVAKLPNESRSALVPVIVSVEAESEKDWRMRDIIASQLDTFCVLFSNQDVEEYIIPMWERMLLDKVSQVREKACFATKAILTVTDRKVILQKLGTFATSDTFRHRQMFLKCANSFPSVLDATLLNDLVLPILIQLSTDNVVIIRLSLAKLFLDWMENKTSSSLPSGIDVILAKLEKDNDSDVSYFAAKAIEAQHSDSHSSNKLPMLSLPIRRNMSSSSVSPRSSLSPRNALASSSSSGPSTENDSDQNEDGVSVDLLDMAITAEDTDSDDSESEADLTESEADLSDNDGDYLSPRYHRHGSLSSDDAEEEH